MNAENRVKFLRIALIVFGLIFLIGVYPLTIVWPAGWAWHHTGQSMYLQMILGIYATLDIFLLLERRARRNHGRAIDRKSRTPRASPRRRASAVDRRRCLGILDAATPCWDQMRWRGLVVLLCALSGTAR